MDPLALINRYYTEGSPLHTVLLQHSLDVTELALELVDAHPELPLDRAFVEEAAMLHDIGIFLTEGDQPYILHGYLGAELLRREGYPRHAQVAERHTGSGLLWSEIQQRGIALPEGIYVPVTLEEELICYADKFFSKTKLGQRKTLEKVRSGFSKHGEAALARFDFLHEKFGR